MKKTIAFLLALVMSLSLLTACGSKDDNKDGGKASSSESDLDYVKSAGKLVIGITEYKPMNYYEGDELVGFDTEFANAVCEKLGVKADFQVIDWETKESLLKAKNIDCIWNGLTVTEERKENMDFSKVYLLNKQVVVINKKDADKFTDTASLSSALLSAEAESAGESAIQADENLSKGSYTASDKQMSALTSLVAGNYDAVVLDYTLAMANCGKGDYKDLMIVDSINLTNEEYAIGFRKGSDLTAEVNSIIEALIADNTLSDIAAKYELTDLYNEAVK